MTFREQRTTTSLQSNHPRIAIFRALQLGDMLCAVPALRALRAGFPRAHIALIGLPWARQFVARFKNYVDDFIAFPGHPALPERAPDIAAVPGFLEDVRARNFDLAVQMQGKGTITNALVSWFGAADVAGFYPAGDSSPNNGSFVRYEEAGSEIQRLMRLALFLGGEDKGESLEFPLHDGDYRQLIALVPDLKPGSYVCVHAGARSPSRRWRPEYFADAADALAAEGLSVVLTGTRRERAQVESIRAAMKGPALNLAGATSLGALAVLLAGARLLVCNDTGVSHLASALSVRSVVVFTGSDRDRWAPRDRLRHRSLLSPSKEEVIAAARRQLADCDYVA